MFFKKSEPPARVNLNPAEKTALDALGKSLPCLGGTSLSTTFTLYGEIGWRGRHEISSTGEAVVLYIQKQAEGGPQGPSVEFLYAPKPDATPETSLLHVAFISAAGGMKPVILKAPRDALGHIGDDSVRCYAAQSVMAYLAACESGTAKTPNPGKPENPHV